MKNKISVIFIVVILFTILPFSLLSQEKTSLHQGNDNWEIYKEVDGIQINYKYLECNKPNQGIYKEYVVFQIINTTSNSVEVNYTQSLWYDGNKILSENDEYKKSTILEPEQVFETYCDKNREYNIFSKFLNYNKAELTRFEIVEIKVNQIKR